MILRLLWCYHKLFQKVPSDQLISRMIVLTERIHLLLLHLTNQGGGGQVKYDF